MEPDQYKYMFEAEDRHWWYVGNHEIFIELLRRQNILKDNVSVLDAGCGTGKWLEMLKSSFDIHETGIDYSPIALQYAANRGKMNLILSDIGNCTFESAGFDLITSLDVICNSNLDDNHAIRNFFMWLKKDGYLLLSLPAYKFLLGKHDKMVHQDKRYKRKQLNILLENRGFEIVRSSYCVCLLFPVALIKRMANKFFSTQSTEHNELKMPAGIINQSFLFAMRLEKIMLRYFSLPFGLSVFVLARKK